MGIEPCKLALGIGVELAKSGTMLLAINRD